MARVDPEKIEAARVFAENEVREFLAHEPPRGETGRGRVACFLWWHFNLSWADGPRGPYILVSDLAAGILCEVALEDADVRELVTDIIASRINNDISLTNDLKNFVFLALKNGLPKPKTKPGTKVSQRFERDMFIIWTLSDIEKRFGVPPTENDSRSKAVSPSGMGILAKCFRDNGYGTSPKAMKDVWLNKKKRKWADQIAEAISNHKEPSQNAFADLIARVGS